MLQISLLQEQGASLETKCKRLETQTRQNTVQHQQGAQSLQATLQRNRVLEGERQDLVGRTQIAERSAALMEQLNEDLKQQVISRNYLRTPICWVDLHTTFLPWKLV